MSSEWLALILITYFLGGYVPLLTDVADFFYKIHLLGDCYQFHPWLFENLEQLVTLSGTISKTEGMCWLSHHCVNIT